MSFKLNYLFENNYEINEYNAKDVLLKIEEFFFDDNPPINYIPDIFPKTISNNLKYSQYENEILKRNKFGIIDKFLISFFISSMYDDDIYIFERLESEKLYFDYNLSIKDLHKYIERKFKSSESQYISCILFFNLNIVFYIGDFSITYFSLIEDNSYIEIINSIFSKNGFFIKINNN